MPEKIKISIITPSYNQGKYIEETILSVLNQTYQNIEYILVDGGSTDNTMEIVERYRDKIDIVISEKDNGQADAINKGFKLATGQLVGWLNSDDVLYPDCIERIVELYRKNPNGAIYYHSFNDVINDKGEITKTYQHIIPDKNHLLRINYSVIQQGSFYNRFLVEKVGYLDITNHYCMDLDLWLNLLDEGSILYTKDKSHSGFRMYKGTKTDTGQEKFLMNIASVLKKHGARVYYYTMWYMVYFYCFKVKVKKMLKI